MLKKSYWAVFLVLTLLFSACSTRKDSFKNRAYHNMTSWFNALFNGQEAMDAKLEELKSSYQDDYFETLRVEPLEAFEKDENPEYMVAPTRKRSVGVRGFVKDLIGNNDNNSKANGLRSGNLLNNETSSATGFEKAEEKAMKVIANHSMLIKNKERNRLIERAYLMLGKARYYQGKPFQAMDALQYAQDLQFDKHEAEAKYFVALSQIQAGNKFAAAKILDEMYQDDTLDKQMIANIAKHLAYLYYEQGDLASALNGLDRAIQHTKSKDEEARLNYIQAQILTQMGRLDEANSKYARVFRLKPGFEMEARSQVATALNFDPVVDDYAAYKHQLMKLLRTGTYETYRNEFFYALGKVEEKRDSMRLAEEAYKKALQEPPSDSRFRAETYAAMGGLKFKESDYVYASAYYDSAVTAIGEGKRKDELTSFRDNLKTVTDKYYLVQRNDSILRLTAMTEKERANYFNDYIEDLKKKDELQRQKEEETTQFLTQGKRSSFGDFEENEGKFYFYSNTAKSNGENEFKRIWGDRPLRDNWRISSTGSSIAEQKAELTGVTSLNNPRRYELDFYLEKIPSSESEIKTLKMERDTTELSLGTDYFDKFKDVRLATSTLEHLVATPPLEEEVLLKAYYNLYRINADENIAVSEKYKKLVLEGYPNTTYAEFILNPQGNFTEENSPEVLALYNETYTAYKEGDYALVKEKAAQAVKQYAMAKIIAKFALLNAYADGALEGEEPYKAGLERVIILYPETEEAAHAQSLLDGLNKKDNAQTKQRTTTKNNTKKKKPSDAKARKIEQIRNQRNIIEKGKLPTQRRGTSPKGRK